jgi:hypothetical protein
MFAVTGSSGWASGFTVRTKCNNSRCGLVFFQPHDFKGLLRCPHCNHDQ